MRVGKRAGYEAKAICYLSSEDAQRSFLKCDLKTPAIKFDELQHSQKLQIYFFDEGQVVG